METTSRPRMGRSNAILEKKLLELESGLGQLFHPSSPNGVDEITGSWPCDLESLEFDIRKRIAFLKYLLAAEMECHSGDAPAHLQNIANRLASYDRAFSDWVDLKVMPPEGDVDDSTACSCNHECFSGPEIEEEENLPKPEEEYLLEEDLNVPQPEEEYFLEEEETVPKPEEEYVLEEEEDVPKPEEEYFLEEEEDVPKAYEKYHIEEDVQEDETSEDEEDDDDDDDREVEKPSVQGWCNVCRGQPSAGFVCCPAISARIFIAAATAATMMVMAANFYGGDEEFYLVPT